MFALEEGYYFIRLLSQLGFKRARWTGEYFLTPDNQRFYLEFVDKIVPIHTFRY